MPIVSSANRTRTLGLAGECAYHYNNLTDQWSSVGFENRDPGSGNSRDLMNFLASRFPVFLTKIPGIFSTVTQNL